MGQKVNPHGFRVGVIKDWDSRWYASNEKVGDLLVEDHKIRDYLKKTPVLLPASPRSRSSASNAKVRIYLHCARPGVVIGKGGEQIEEYRKSVDKLIGKTVNLNIVEVRNPDMDAQLVAENIAAAAGEAHRLPPRHEECHGPRHARRRQGHQVPAPAVWAALRSPAPSTITTAPSPCRPCAPTSTTASLRLPPPMAASA